MGSHFSALGFDVPNSQAYVELAREAIRKGEQIRSPAGIFCRWSAGSGAEIWTLVNPAKKPLEILDCNPHFSGKASMRVGLAGRVIRDKQRPYEGAFACWAGPSSSTPMTGVYPFVFDPPDYASYASLTLPTVRKVQLAAFAHTLSVFPDVTTMRSDKRYEMFGAATFIPSGTFKPGGGKIDPPQSMVIFTGTVLETEKLTNTVTGLPFYWAKVGTLEGEFDVVADPQIVNGSLNVNSVVLTTSWVSGRIMPA